MKWLRAAVGHIYGSAWYGLRAAVPALMVCLLVSANLWAAEPPGTITIYFYSPETNINNFKSLKVEFDTYLKNFGPYTFQPFSNRERFEAFIQSQKGGVYLISSWHYNSLKTPVDFQPVLVGQTKGKSTQKKVLSAPSGIKDFESLRGEVIASSGSSAYTRDTLIKMLGESNKDLVNSIQILQVPKDLDALLAMGYGMAKAALTTDGSLNKFSVINPKQRELLHVLAESPETLLPIVVVAGDGQQSQGLLSVLSNMGTDQMGQKGLRMLGLDALKTLDDVERKALK